VRRALAAHCLALLGRPGGPLAVAGPGAARVAAALPSGTAVIADVERAAGAIASFLGAAAPPAARRATLVAVRDRLPPGARLVRLDHNQPRSWWQRAVGVAALALRGLPPARARYPAARELASLGLDVERLRLAQGERVQLVVARRDGAPELVVPPGEQVEGAHRGRWR
jgi:hypothetical protein